jgi:hypothetical protein
MSGLVWSRRHRLFRYAFKKFVLWRGQPRPRRMYRRGRPVDPLLSPTERLFLRCQCEWVDVDRIKPAHIHFPDQSVNREKYSYPTDVLLPDATPRSADWVLWGVVAFQVADVPADSTTSGGVSYRFTAEHDPLEDNFGHTELRVYKDGVREQNKDRINPKIKKEYRTRLALRTRLIVPPLI